MTLSLELRFSLAHKYITHNSPLSEQREQSLIARVSSVGANVLDLGCGIGTLLRHTVLACGNESQGDGVDANPLAITRANELLTSTPSLQERVRFHCQDGKQWQKTANIVLCVGARHIWPNLEEALLFLQSKCEPKARVLYGDAIWTKEPTDEIHELLGPQPTLASLIEIATHSGFQLLHASSSTLDEWDDFENDWRRAFEEHPDAMVQTFATERRSGFYNGYRGTLGFAWLILQKR